jgi:hypothetical protein
MTKPRKRKVVLRVSASFIRGEARMSNAERMISLRQGYGLTGEARMTKPYPSSALGHFPGTAGKIREKMVLPNCE